MLLGSTCEGDSSEVGYPGTLLDPDYGAPVSISLTANIVQLVQDALYFNSRILTLRIAADNINMGAAFNASGTSSGLSLLERDNRCESVCGRAHKCLCFVVGSPAAPSLTLGGDSLDGIRNCFTPGITVNNAACVGTDNECAAEASCDSAAGYYGVPQVQCLAAGGTFRTSSCFRTRCVVNANQLMVFVVELGFVADKTTNMSSMVANSPTWRLFLSLSLGLQPTTRISKRYITQSRRRSAPWRLLKRLPERRSQTVRLPVTVTV